MLKKIFYIFLLFISIKAVGQRTNSSPYSFFGIGEQYNSQTVEQASMGGVGLAYTNQYHLNFLNPASNSNLRFATYSFGANVNDLTIKDSSGSPQRSTSTSLSYINIGFPVGKRAGVSFGLKPNTSVGYSLFNVENDTNGDPVEGTRFYGSGGTSKLYGAFGISVTKNLSLGIEGEFVFGKTENNILSQRVGSHLGTKNIESAIVRGNGLTLGLLYNKELADELIVNIGATLKFGNSLNTKGSEYLYSVLIATNTSESPRDTLYSNTVNGSIKYPIKTGLGIGLGKTNKWFAGIDYIFQESLNIEGSILTNNSTYSYGKSNRISVGGFYLPKVNSISSYWERVTYRAGLRVENTGLLINNSSSNGDFTEIKDFGISFGLGLPLSGLSNLNLGLEYGKKGTAAKNLIQENYFNVKLSLSLNAIGNLAWFRQRKIE